MWKSLGYLEELDPIVDCESGRGEAVKPIHDHWDRNLFLKTTFDQGLDAVAAEAPIKVDLELSTARQVMHPMEGKGLVACGTIGQDSSSSTHRRRCRI